MHPTKPPVKWKIALLTWACIYPLLNLLFLLLMPRISHWPQWSRTLLLTVILVPLMGMLLSVLQKRLAGAINKVLIQTEGFGGVDEVYFKSFLVQ